MMIIDWVREAPRRIFVLDAAGALYSAFMLGVVLRTFPDFFGVPVSALIVLASAPVCFALFDVYAWRTAERGFRTKVRAIALANLGYCVLSLGVAFVHRAEIRALGWGYLVAEIIVVLALARWEWRMAAAVPQYCGTKEVI